MKRVSARKKWRLIRVSRKRAMRSVESRQRRRDLRRKGLTYQTASRPRQHQKTQILVEAPQTLSIVGPAYKDTIQFLEKVRTRSLIDDKRVVMDLRKVEKISPDVALMLVAEVQRIKSIKGGSAISGASPYDDICRRRLHAMGLFKALNLYDPFSVKKGDDTQAIYSIETGTTLDGVVTKRIADEFAEALSLENGQRDAIQRAFNEALENISEHAYYDKTKLSWPAEAARWWICSVTSTETKGAFLLACDLGMTIPATVAETAKKRGPENLAALAAHIRANITMSEGERLLGAAFEEGVTRRVGGKGGRGLGKMAALVHEFPQGHLHVLSGDAVASISSGDTKVRLKPLPHPFAGTYVLWHLALGDGDE